MSSLLPAKAAPSALASRNVPWLFLVLLEIGAVAVFWAFDALPFMDLPAHAGVIGLHLRFPQSAFEQRYFVLAPHLGAYSLFRFFGAAFARWMGPVDAVRVLATLPVIATPLAMLYARRCLYGDKEPFFAFIAFILCFGYMTMMGFASYLLAIAILLVATAQWLMLMAKADSGGKTALAETKLAALAALVFLAHGFAFMVFAFVAAVTALAAGSAKARLPRLRVLAPAALLVAYAAWAERASGLPAIAVPPPVSLSPAFQSILDKLSLLATPTLMTRTGIDLLIGIGIWFAVIFAATASYRSLSASRSNLPLEAKNHVRAAAVASAATFLAFLALPYTIGWFGFVDARLLPIVILLGLLAIDPHAVNAGLRRAATVAAGAAALIIVGLVLVASHLFQAEASGYREVFSAIPAKSRILYFPLEPDSTIFVSHPFVHYDKLILAQRPSVPSDIWFHQGTAIYPTAANPVLRLPPDYISSDLKQIVWSHYRLTDWNYVLIRQAPNAPAPKVPSGLTLADHRGGWWLFRNGGRA